jgi:hypothetical protein
MVLPIIRGEIMLVGLCFVAFVVGIAAGSYYKENAIEEQNFKKLSHEVERARKLNKKQEYLDYVWRSYE